MPSLFVDRLVNAVKEKQTAVVGNMLDALRYTYLENDFSIVLSLNDRFELGEEKTSMLGIALHYDVESFKLLTSFFKHNKNLKIFRKTFYNILVHAFYKSIFSKNLTAIRFLVEEIEVNLLASSNGFKQVYSSPLIGADDDVEIFQYLLPYCIAAYQKVKPGETKALIEPVKANIEAQLSQKKAHIHEENLLPEAEAKKILKEIDVLNAELDLVECYLDIETIFSSGEDMLVLYSEFANGFKKNKIFSLTIIGHFMEALAAKDELEKKQELTEKFICYITTLLECIYRVVNSEKEGKDKEKLKNIIGDCILPHYFSVITFYGFLKSTTDKEFERAMNLSSYFQLSLAWTTMRARPGDLVPLKLKNTKDSKNEKIKIVQSEKEALAANPCVLYELGNLYVDQKRFHEAIEQWSCAAQQGRGDALDQLYAFNTKPPSLVIESHANFVLGNLYSGKFPKSKIPKNIFLTLHYWSRALKNTSSDQESNPYISELKDTLFAIIINDQKNIKERYAAWSVLLKYFITDGKPNDILEWMRYGIEVFGLKADSFVKEIYMLNEFIANPPLMNFANTLLETLPDMKNQVLSMILQILDLDAFIVAVALLKLLKSSPESDNQNILLAIKILGLGASQGSQACLRKLGELGQQFLCNKDSEFHTLRKALFIEYAKLSPCINELIFSSGRIARVRWLDETIKKFLFFTKKRGGIEWLNKTFVLQSHEELKRKLRRWLDDAINQYNANVADEKLLKNENKVENQSASTAKGTYFFARKPASSLTAAIYDAISFVNQLLDSVAAIRRHERSEIKLLNKNNRIVTIGEIEDVYDAIDIFLEDRRYLPYEPLSDLKEIFEDHCEENLVNIEEAIAIRVKSFIP